MNEITRTEGDWGPEWTCSEHGATRPVATYRWNGLLGTYGDRVKYECGCLIDGPDLSGH